MITIQPIGYTEFLQAMGVPNFLINRANKYNLKRGGKDFNSSCMSQVKGINVPVMVVQNTNDPWTNLDWVKQYYNELTVEKEMYWLKGEKRRLYAYDYFGHSPERMLNFFDKYINKN